MFIFCRTSGHQEQPIGHFRFRHEHYIIKVKTVLQSNDGFLECNDALSRKYFVATKKKNYDDEAGPSLADGQGRPSTRDARANLGVGRRAAR